MINNKALFFMGFIIYYKSANIINTIKKDHSPPFLKTQWLC
jgi:hypothetical protein